MFKYILNKLRLNRKIAEISEAQSPPISSTEVKILKIIAADKLLQEATEPNADDEILLSRRCGDYVVQKGISCIARTFNKPIREYYGIREVVINGVTFYEVEK